MIRGEAAAYTATAAAWIAWNVWPLLAGILARLFFDALSGRGPLGLDSWAIVALIVASGLARAGVLVLAAAVGVPMRSRMRALLQQNILWRILRLSGARPLPMDVGEAVSTLRDDTDAAALATDWPYDAAAGLVFALGGIGILLTVDARVTVLVFVPIALLIGLGAASRGRLVQVRARSRAATARVTGAIAEIFGSVHAIQAGAAEERVVAHLRALSDERRRAMVADRLQGLVFDSVFEYTMHLGAGLVLLVAASAMRSGSFTVGDFALFATYLLQVADFTGFIGYLIGSYQQSAVSFRRMEALLQGAPGEELIRPQVGPRPVAGVDGNHKTSRANAPLQRLEVRNLTFLHPGGRGIHGASFGVQRGQVCVVTGSVASGKTTLVRAALGLLDPLEGEILWNGEAVDAVGDFLRPPRAAYVPQVPRLLSGSLRDNVLLGMPAGPDELARAAHIAVFERDLLTMPERWETQVGDRGMRLSGGQVLRTAIARAIVRRPELLVLDDVSSALDVETEETLWERLLSGGQTILVVSNRTGVLRHADQILHVENGVVLRRE